MGKKKSKFKSKKKAIQPIQSAQSIEMVELVKPKSPEPQETSVVEVVETSTINKDIETPPILNQNLPLAEDNQNQANVSEDSNENAENQNKTVDKKTVYFQGIGILQGDVNFDEEGKATITVDGITFPLKYCRNRKRSFLALQREVKATGARQDVVVYPHVIHFPQRDKDSLIYFEIVGFRTAKININDNEVTADLVPGEFVISGVWQFIPASRVPCISVFKNFSKERLQYLNQLEDELQKKKFMKAAHLPLYWRDSSVKPFRYNPKAEKDQQETKYFIRIKATFLPEKSAFGFKELITEPIVNPPNHFKPLKAQKPKSDYQKPKSDYQKQKNVSPIVATSTAKKEPPKLKTKQSA